MRRTRAARSPRSPRRPCGTRSRQGAGAAVAAPAPWVRPPGERRSSLLVRDRDLDECLAVECDLVELRERLLLEDLAHWCIVDRGREVLSSGQRPGEEVDERLGLACVRLVLVDERERRAGDRVGEGRAAPRQAGAEVRRERGLDRGCARRRDAGRDERALLVLDVGVGQLARDRVLQLGIADCALGLADEAGDAVVALGADADRPRDGLAERLGRAAELARPARARLREEVAEDRRRARGVRAVDDRDRLVRQVRLGVELRDRAVAPVRDLAVEDPADRLAVELEAARGRP